MTIVFLATAAPLAADSPGPRPRLWIGTDAVDIMPPLPVVLTGFQSVRLTRKIQSPLMANVLALESRAGDRTIDQAILVSCDLCSFRPGMEDAQAAWRPRFSRQQTPS